MKYVRFGSEIEIEIEIGLLSFEALLGPPPPKKAGSCGRHSNLHHVAFYNERVVGHTARLATLAGTPC